MRSYTGLYEPETLRTVAELGGQGILTNANTIYKFFGSEKTLDEITQWMLDNSFGMPVFPSIHGKDTRSIVEVGRRLHALDPQRVGVKILSNTQGFSAMRVLSAEGVRCVATGMFTYTQALIAAYSGAVSYTHLVDLGQALGDILMYGGLTDVKFLGGLPHGGPSFDDVLGETDGPVLR